MSKIEVKYRRPLNDQQVKVLHWLYNVRFSTCKQIALHLRKKDHRVIQNKLQILEQQGFIGKRYDKTYKLRGIPAEYYLTPKGSRELEKHKPKSTNKWAVKALYKNKTISEDFLTHCVNVAEAIFLLQFLYGDKLNIYTKSYMVQYSNYPSWTPDLYLTLKVSGQEQRKTYFVDVWDGTKPFFVSVKKTRNYVRFKDTGDWLEDQDFPVVIAICNDLTTQKKLARQMKRILDEEDGDMLFAATTKQQLENATKTAERIWLKPDPYGEASMTTLRAIHSLGSTF
jgi:DNA-binding HxlR family transcriptional regulator